MNRGQLPQYYLPNNHEPVIPREIFYLAQGERLMREARKRTPAQEKRYMDPFQGGVRCGICGRIMRRVLMPDNTVEWRCIARAGRRRTISKEHIPSCTCPAIPEEILRWAFLCAIGRLPEYRDQIDEMQKSIEHKEELKMLQERLVHLEEAEKHRNSYQEKLELYAAGADFARSLRRLRTLRTLADVVCKTAILAEDAGGACYDAEEFNRMTDRLNAYADVSWKDVCFRVFVYWKGTPTGQTRCKADGECRTRTGVWMAGFSEQTDVMKLIAEIACDMQILRFVDSMTVDRTGIIVHFYGRIDVDLQFVVLPDEL